jgi:hypothetical protein
MLGNWGKWRGTREIGDETCPAGPLFIGSENLQITSCHHLALLHLDYQDLIIMGMVAARINSHDYRSQ